MAHTRIDECVVVRVAKQTRMASFQLRGWDDDYLLDFVEPLGSAPPTAVSFDKTQCGTSRLCFASTI